MPGAARRAQTHRVVETHTARLKTPEPLTKSQDLCLFTSNGFFYVLNFLRDLLDASPHVTVDGLFGVSSSSFNRRACQPIDWQGSAMGMLVCQPSCQNDNDSGMTYAD